jgi:hypothetical protein
MNSKVKVTADAAGNVIVTSKNNSNYGFIRVEQDRMVIDERGFARKKRVSALIPGTVADLKGFGWKKDEEVDGKITIKEQTTPFNINDPERDYKIAGKTGIVCCLYGEPIYRKAFFTMDPRACDVTIAHDNGDAIKAAYAELSEAEAKGEESNLTL